MKMLWVGACGAWLIQAQPALVLEKTIPLPGVQGRIDHLAIDAKGQRLFVAALGNNTLEVIDLRKGERTAAIKGLQEPQGVLYIPGANRIFVANRKDGTVRLYDGSSLQLLKSVPYGNDADNLRCDAATRHVYAGYGDGALGELDEDGNRVGEIRLDAHPESFQLETSGPRIFVNLPDSQKIAVVDRRSRTVVATWRTGNAAENYPMALDEADHRLFVVCRRPAKLIVFDTAQGREVAALNTAGDCDDVFYDRKRKRIYAIGGEGAIAVITQLDAGRYRALSRIATRPGARTGLFSPELDRLFVAAGANGGAPAWIRVYRAEKE